MLGTTYDTQSNSELRDSLVSSSDDLKLKPSRSSQERGDPDQRTSPEVTGLGPRQASLRGEYPGCEGAVVTSVLCRRGADHSEREQPG